jgi:hypothetical protein
MSTITPAEARFIRRLRRALALAHKDGVCVYCAHTALLLALADFSAHPDFDVVRMLGHLQKANLVNRTGILVETETTTSPPAGTRH